LIERPVFEVAAYVGEPANAPEWYANIESVRWRTEPPVAVATPMMSAAMRRANQKDLAGLTAAAEAACSRVDDGAHTLWLAN
jgi:hypothetical protein